MRDVYPLGAVLKLRRLEKDQRVQDLLSARARARDSTALLEQARDEERVARGRLDEARHAERGCARGGARADELLAHARRLEALGHELEQAALATAEARDVARGAARAVEGARARLARARADLEAVERHMRSWEEERRRRAELGAEEDP